MQRWREGGNNLGEIALEDTEGELHAVRDDDSAVIEAFREGNPEACFQRPCGPAPAERKSSSRA